MDDLIEFKYEYGLGKTNLLYILEGFPRELNKIKGLSSNASLEDFNCFVRMIGEKDAIRAGIENIFLEDKKFYPQKVRSFNDSYYSVIDEELKKNFNEGAGVVDNLYNKITGFRKIDY